MEAKEIKFEQYLEEFLNYVGEKAKTRFEMSPNSFYLAGYRDGVSDVREGLERMAKEMQEELKAGPKEFRA